MSWTAFTKILGLDTGDLVKNVGKGIGSVMDRLGFIEQMSDVAKIEKYVEVFKLNEASTADARQLFMTEMRTQKQPFVIRTLNGLIRPLGGLGALLTEFYVIWGSNVAIWFDVTFVPITLSVETHLVLGAIISFYFGSRLKENLGGVTTRR